MASTILVAFITAGVTAVAGYFIQKNRLDRDYKFDREKIRTEYMAEEVVKRLLETTGWDKRSFKAIKKRLGGFENDELRKILVRAGAVRFETSDKNDELWGLLSKNKNSL